MEGFQPDTLCLLLYGESSVPVRVRSKQCVSAGQNPTELEPDCPSRAQTGLPLLHRLELTQTQKLQRTHSPLVDSKVAGYKT
ncbi:hypothetical protein QQF64_017429 [Cirrhinus molitorella]|uniref:Uncharacterized protein n=1 Tax=Cirrhinus molitorella TaxID=172907 RepID=A0ABR3LKZ6_9TELE